MERRSFLGISLLGLLACALPSTEVCNSSDKLISDSVPALLNGNESVISKKKYDLYIDPRCLEDIKNWGVDQIDPQTQREIYENTNPCTLHHIDSVSFVVTNGDSQRTTHI